jgi:hypothetical protein
MSETTVSIKWMTTPYTEGKIERIECTKETEKCIWFDRYKTGNPSRCDKNSRYEKFHDSWEAARDYQLQSAQRASEIAADNLETYKKLIVEINNMQHP